MRVLVVNAGSSSLKLSLVGDGDRLLAHDDKGDLEAFARSVGPVDAVGHRVVHGGDRFAAPVVIDAGVRAALEDLVDLAPLHLPPGLAAVDAAAELYPDVPAVASFDTAFHATMPPAATSYALPRAWTQRWPLRRYGFHGLSHAWAARRGPEVAGRPDAVRVVTCHLGSGASCCAVLAGRSVDTTMGFTPLEGLVMATRSGTVDPGLVLWLIEQGGMAPADVLDGLQRSSGLAGLTGGTGDMRAIAAAAVEGDATARAALDIWVHRLRAAIASMAAAAGGLDVLVFTGGVGEHQPALRAEVCAGLRWLGVAVDEDLNREATSDLPVSPAGAPVAVAVVTAREDLQIAGEVRRVLAAAERR